MSYSSEAKETLPDKRPCKVMMYTRAPAVDYDDWAHVYNNPGWSFNELLTFIKKVRRLHGLTYRVPSS